MKLFRRAVGAVVSVALALVASTTASAGYTSLSFVSTVVDGHGTIGKYDGSLGFSHTAGNSSATLTITLNNLLSTASGGKLTGFVLNGPAVSGLTYALTAKPNSSWSKTGAAENAAPFGSYSLGAALGGSFLGGGSPNPGLAVGSSFSFEFSVNGASSLLETLSASSFWNGMNGNPAFLARFKGFTNGGSDKSPAALAMQVVPIPAPVLLAGAGLLGAFAIRRRLTRG